MQAAIPVRLRRFVSHPTSITPPSVNTRRGPSLFDVVRGREFRLFWIGQGISCLGDQFYLIALPWLVLRLTGDPLAMGTVLALASTPRAAFMLIGGALTDRFSSRTLMLYSDILRTCLVAGLAGIVLTGRIELWMIYLFAVTFGLVDAFFYPASNSIVPQLVKEEQLGTGNAIVQGTQQLTLIAGPVVAGVLIAVLDGGTAGSVRDLLGIGIAFGFDAFTFLISVMSLWLMKRNQPASTDPTASKPEGVWAAIRDGLVYVKQDGVLGTFFAVTAAITLLIAGPFAVGVPVLAESRFPQGAAAFGMIMSAFGGGMLLGTLSTGILPKPAPARFGMTLLLLTSGLGVGMVLLGLAPSAILAAGVGLAMGAADGYIEIAFITWLQSRTPAAMLGRMMSLLMFALMGLNPLSIALAGMLIKLDATALLVGAGGLLVVFPLLAMFSPAIKAMGMENGPAHA